MARKSERPLVRMRPEGRARPHSISHSILLNGFRPRQTTTQQTPLRGKRLGVMVEAGGSHRLTCIAQSFTYTCIDHYAIRTLFVLLTQGLLKRII